MATTFHDYNGNQGTGTNSAEYDFSFPTFKQEEVKVEVDNVVKDLTTHFTVPTYSATTGGKIRFTTGNIPTLSTQKVRVYRETDVDGAKATFTAGSSLKANELNTNITLLLRSTQDRTNAKNVQTHDLNDRAVTTDKIKDANVTRAKLEADIIDGTKIANDAVDSEHIAADSLDTEHYAPSSVDSTAIANNAITMDKLSSGALPTDITVNSDNIVNGSIVNADVNTAAAIAGTKISPAFGSQNVSTSGTLASGSHTVTGDITVSGTVDGRDVAALGTKLDTIETNAKDDQTAAEIKSLYESVSDTNEFSDAFKSKLQGIENSATADQTAAEIRTLVEAASDSNVFTDADHSKLNAIEPSATADQTNAEIKTAYEANANTNEFSDAEQSKLAGIEDNATIDQTAAEIKTLLQSNKLELSEINTTSTDSRYFTETELTGGALDGRYYTETEAEAKFLRQDSSETIASGATWSNSDAFVATTAAINARILDLVDDVGGFTAIANQTSFPTTNPQGTTGQAAILSISATTATLTPSGTTVTIPNGAGSGNTVTITGVTATIPTGFGFLVESTSTTHTYSFHRLVPKATEVTTVATNITNIVNAGANVADINNFADKYQIASSAPTQRADGSSLQEGDLWYDSSNDNLLVYSGSAFAIITPSQSVLDDVAIVSGAITYSEDLGLITSAASTGSSNGSLDIVADTIEDEVTFTVTASGGAYFIDGVSKPALTLYKGWTYTFDLSSNTLGSHPLRFSSGGSAYNTGVTVTGTQGSSGAKVQLVVPESQPTSFAYYCTNHSGMGNTITVKDDPIKTVSDNVTEIVAVAGNSTNINAVAGNNSNITSVAGNATNINAVQSNASNINAVAGNATNINAVAADATDIGAVAGKATEIVRLGTAAAVADLAILGTNAIVSDMDTLADISSNITSVANNESNINSAVSNASNINSAVSNASNINTVAGNNTNINTVAGISSNVTTVAGISANVTSVAGISSNVTSVADNSSNINSAVSNASNINTVAGSISNVNSVGASIANVNTAASNLTSINNFGNRYRIASSAPTSSLDQGDLYFDTSSNELRVYNSSAWQGGVTATGNLPSNGANTFTGDQTVQANIIVTGTVDGRDVATDGSKLDGIEASATADQTAAEIRTLVESASDSNVFTDADHSKLNGIEASATADQTAAEIRTLVESASDSNVFTDADHSKLNGIEASATADQTASEIVSLISGQTIAPNVITTTNLTLDFGSIA